MAKGILWRRWECRVDFIGVYVRYRNAGEANDTRVGPRRRLHSPTPLASRPPPRRRQRGETADGRRAARAETRRSGEVAETLRGGAASEQRHGRRRGQVRFSPAGVAASLLLPTLESSCSAGAGLPNGWAFSAQHIRFFF